MVWQVMNILLCCMDHVNCVQVRSYLQAEAKVKDHGKWKMIGEWMFNLVNDG